MFMPRSVAQNQSTVRGMGDRQLVPDHQFLELLLPLPLRCMAIVPGVDPFVRPNRKWVY